MRFRTLEIRWHDSKPIASCDFQPAPVKKARPPPGQERNYAAQSYRLATGGEDNHVRIWMVHPHLRPPAALADADPAAVPRPPRVEYLATLSRHSAAVNVVRFSPNGELIASAGDDGMIIIWAPSASPQAATYGSDLTAEELQNEKEYWKPRTTFRCTTMQVYDLAWSPTGEYIIAGSTDNTARVFVSADGKCVHEIAEHLHYVQGVAWDPLNEYIATQSSDRSMHIYRILTKPGGAFEAHAVGKNTRMPHRHSQSHSRAHSRTPSAHGGARPLFARRASMASDAEGGSAFALDLSEDAPREPAPLTPATSVGGTPAFMFPPPPIEGSSRRSSFSSNAPGSPSPFSAAASASAGGGSSRYARSPSPMPPLPAIRAQPAAAAGGALWANVKLYGDESYTNFFRRLTFSPDGALLLTPAGQFEDPSVLHAPRNGSGEDGGTPSRGRRGHPADTGGAGTASSVYIYSRANFARPPVAQLPGHKKASVAVRFSPVLYELRPGVAPTGGSTVASSAEPPAAVLERGVDGDMRVEVVGPLGGAASTPAPPALMTPQKTHTAPIETPTPTRPGSGAHPAASPALSPMDLRPPTPAASQPSTPAPAHSQSGFFSQSQEKEKAPATGTGSVFALPYRMLFAVVTMDTVAIYDTQQAAPLCLLTKLHYDEFTDMTWSPDGQTLILAARDGYCTLVMFDDILPAHHTQQHAMQMQAIAHNNYVPLTYAPGATPTHGHAHAPSQGTSHAGGSQAHAHALNQTPTLSQTTMHSQTSIHSQTAQSQSQTPVQPAPPNAKKRAEPPLTPAASVDGSEAGASVFGAAQVAAAVASSSSSSMSAVADAPGETSVQVQEPPKKKRRVALTRIGDLEP